MLPVQYWEGDLAVMYHKADVVKRRLGNTSTISLTHCQSHVVYVSNDEFIVVQWLQHRQDAYSTNSILFTGPDNIHCSGAGLQKLNDKNFKIKAKYFIGVVWLCCAERVYLSWFFQIGSVLVQLLSSIIWPNKHTGSYTRSDGMEKWSYISSHRVLECA